MNINILNIEKDKTTEFTEIKNIVLADILCEFEKVHFLGRKQIKELKKILETQENKTIHEVVYNWLGYLKETPYNDKFNEKFLFNVVERYFNDAYNNDLMPLIMNRHPS